MTIATLEREDVRIEWVYLDEGFSGEYNPNDPDDVAFLRFDLMKKIDGEWEYVENGSYCTHFSYDATTEQKKRGLELLMKHAYPLLKKYPENNEIKRMAEKLSHIGLDKQGEPFVPQYILDMNY